MTESYDHPLHRDEDVRIGRIVHAVYEGCGHCASARIVGHDGSVPDELTGRVYLAIDVPHGAMEPIKGTIYRRFAPLKPNDKPTHGTWHWPRACPWRI